MKANFCFLLIESGNIYKNPQQITTFFCFFFFLLGFLVFFEWIEHEYWGAWCKRGKGSAHIQSVLVGAELTDCVCLDLLLNALGWCVPPAFHWASSLGAFWHQRCFPSINDPTSLSAGTQFANTGGTGLYTPDCCLTEHQLCENWQSPCWARVYCVSFVPFCYWVQNERLRRFRLCERPSDFLSSLWMLYGCAHKQRCTEYGNPLATDRLSKEWATVSIHGID